MTSILQDLRLTLRMARANPTWTLTIVLVLGLGIGGNMTMLASFDAWVIRPLDFAEPERLTALHETQPTLQRSGFAVSPKNLDDWRASLTSVKGIESYTRTMFTLRADEQEAERVPGTRISAGLLPLLGKPPVMGRVFSREEDLPGQPAQVVLISHGLWRNRFHSDPAVLERTLPVDDVPHRIVGVMEEGFKFPEYAELWVPLGVDPAAHGRDRRYLSTIARLRDTATLAQANAEIAALAERIATREPETSEGWSAAAEPLRDEWAPPVIRVAITASSGAAIFVLLVICANVANLVLAKSIARGRETALRAVLGATRWRLVRQTITETTVLALLGGLIGGPLGVLSTRLMMGMVPVDPPYLFEFRYDHRALLYTLALSFLAGAVSVTAVVTRMTRGSLFDVLRSGARSGENRRTARLRGLLVCGEVALSTALVVAAVLMVKSFVQERDTDYGYERDNILTARVALTGITYGDADARRAYLDRATAALRELPETELVGAVDELPASPNRRTSLHPEGETARRGEEVIASHHRIGGDYLASIGVAILSGRGLRPAEIRDGADVALVSQRLAAELWPGQDPLGRRLRRDNRAEGTWLRIVGVTADVDPGDNMVEQGSVPKQQIYVPYASDPSSDPAFVVRSRLPMAPLAEAVRKQLRSIGPGVPISSVQSMADAIDEKHWVDRFFSQLLSAYAVLAVAIAAIGVYGVTAESVARRRGEMAVRMALGARSRDLQRLVVSQGAQLGVLGIGIGLALALAMTRFGEAMLRGVSATDPGVFGGVGLLLIAIVIAANWLPARRAAGTDPADALRGD